MRMPSWGMIWTKLLLRMLQARRTLRQALTDSGEVQSHTAQQGTLHAEADDRGSQ